MSDSPTLTIRGQHSDDWSELYNFWSDETVLRELLDLPYMTEDAFRDRFNNILSNVHVLIAEMSSLSGRTQIVGVAWLRANQRARCRHMGDLTLVVQPEQRGADVESLLLDKALDLADNWLGLRRIEVVVFADNEAVHALYEAKGFAREVIMRQYALRDGLYRDAHLLARVQGIED